MNLQLFDPLRYRHPQPPWHVSRQVLIQPPDRQPFIGEAHRNHYHALCRVALKQIQIGLSGAVMPREWRIGLVGFHAHI